MWQRVRGFTTWFVVTGCVLVLRAAPIGCGPSLAPRPAPVAAAAASLPALPRSSIAAVLLHREELGLTDDQVRDLQAVDEHLAEQMQALRDAGDRPPPATPDPPPAGGGGKGGLRMTGPGAMGGGMGGRRGPGGGPRGSGGARHSPERKHGIGTLQDRLDDLDTRAYLHAEESLRPEQREPARDLAEQYREALFDRRSQTGE